MNNIRVDTNSASISTKQDTFIEIRNYLLVLAILLAEDSPFFHEVKLNFRLIILGILLITTISRKNIYNKKIFIFIISGWILVSLQFLLYGGEITPAAVYKPVLYFYTPFLVFAIMGFRYFKYLFNIIYFSAIYTSFIYLLYTFNPAFHDWLIQAFIDFYPYSWSGDDWYRTILIYTDPRFSGYFFERNSGIFHEPGAYSIFLMFAILINTFRTKKPLNGKNIFLSFVLATTFSTTGYVMLYIFIAYALINIKIHVFSKIGILIPTALLLFSIYSNSNFLGSKLDEHYQYETKNVEHGNIDKRGRIYALGMSVKSILESPITGQGILKQHEFNVGKKGSFGYGFAGLFARYGLIFGLFYMFYFYKGFHYITTIYGLPKLFTPTSFIILNLGLFTQIFFYYVPFVYLFIFGLILKEKSHGNYVK